MDMDSMLNFNYLDMAKTIIDRFNDLIRLSERLFPIHDGDTPLLFAVRRNNGNVDEIRKLIDTGQDINVVNRNERNILHEAVINAYRSHSLVKAVLEIAPSMINRPDRLKKTPLHYAMMFNNEKVAQELLNNGADINAKDLYYETPLHIAANFNHNLYSLLLQRGAKIDARNCYFRTPLHCALLRRPPHQNIPLIRSLIFHGANVQAADNEGNSVLHYTMRNSTMKIDIVRLILERGAIPDFKDQRKCPPLNYCVKENIAELLIQYTVLSNFIIHRKLKKEIIIADKMLSLKFCRNNVDRKRYIKFRDACLVDLVHMTNDKISNTLTFYDFVSERYNKATTDKSEELIPDVVLVKLHNNTYSACKEIVNISVKHKALLRKLFHQTIYTNCNISDSQCGEKSVFLNSHCVDHLASFLSRQDVMNLILAYLPSDLKKVDAEKSAAIAVKRKYEDQSISFLVCKRLKVNLINNFNYETGAHFLQES